MKTIIISMLFCVTYLHAQTNYYTTTKTFYESGYTYQCDVRVSGFIALYNKSNTWNNIYPVYKNTGETFAQTDEGVELLENDTWTRSKRFSIVNEAFSTSEKQRVKGHDFDIIMYINSTTGTVDEVNFEFYKSTPYTTIPISTFRKIETEIKKNMTYQSGHRQQMEMTYIRQASIWLDCKILLKTVVAVLHRDGAK